MPVAAAADGEDGEAFEETDPTGRFGRYRDLIGAGSVKKVYRGFDMEEGIEVAWCQVRLAGDNAILSRAYAEARLLQSLRHDHVIEFYAAWTDNKARTLNFVTEVCSSGSLRSYRLRHRQVSVKAVKKWAMQILLGLDYLHSQRPCIIHRDINCSNVFINGNTGEVKIGDLGLAVVVEGNKARSMLGTPEFMAPELYNEDYTESVDIYSFGMCVLEMVTLELPYKECTSIAKIYACVTNGIRPMSLQLVKDPDVLTFIEKCIGPAGTRPTAAELLEDPFFDDIRDDDTESNVGIALRLPIDDDFDDLMLEQC